MLNFVHQVRFIYKISYQSFSWNVIHKMSIKECHEFIEDSIFFVRKSQCTLQLIGIYENDDKFGQRIYEFGISS